MIGSTTFDDVVSALLTARKGGSPTARRAGSMSRAIRMSARCQRPHRYFTENGGTNDETSSVDTPRRSQEAPHDTPPLRLLRLNGMHPKVRA
jgi:hypothetical protein